MVQEFTVQDMTCNGCAATVRKAITGLDGVQSVDIDVLTHSVRVGVAEGVTPETIAHAITNAGYTPATESAPKRAENTITLISASGSSCGDSCCS